MMKKNELVEAIIEGIQEKKGRSIVVANLESIRTAPCQYFVICTAGSPQQVEAITDSIEDYVRKTIGEKPAGIAGRENAIWTVMDYGTVMVHVFVPDAREYYDIEHLWDDANLEQIPDLD